MKNYKSKPIVVQAIQWNGNTNRQDIIDFVGKELETEVFSETAYLAGQGRPYYSLKIETKEGVMSADPGDYIVKEPFPTGDRDFYPVKKEIFERRYEEVN